MTTAALDQQPPLQLSAKTLDHYAAAAGRKYTNMCGRIKQKVKSVPVLDKVVKNVKAWDQKMTQKHGASYKFAKGAVIGTAIGVGLAVAGAEVATAYAAVNAVRAAGNLLAQAEKARQNGQANGFSDFAAKNKTAVGLAAVSIGMSAAGVTAGVIENQAAVSVISAARQAAVGGMMATSTATKIHKINSERKDGKITEGQAKQAKKEQYAELAGNLTGLMAVAGISSQMNTNAAPENQTQASAPAPEQTYDGGTLPEVVVTAQAPAPVPEQTYDGGTLPEVVITAQAPAPEHAPAPEAPVIPRKPIPKLQPVPDIRPPAPEPVLPEIRIPANQSPVNVEKDSFVSYTRMVSPTTNTVNLDISGSDHTANAHETSSLFVEVQDIEGSQAKLMSMSIHDDGRYSNIPTMHIDADGKVTQLPGWHAFPDANGDCRLSEQEIQDWSAKRQASLQTVLSEQEARNIAMTELNEEAKLYNGNNICTIESEQNAGTVKYNGPADGLNKGGENMADKVRGVASQQADKIAGSAREVMCNRIDAQGNACQVNATEKQIQSADILLRSAAGKIR